ncbi:hypothetical protein D3C86_1282750 [compost metagenome]
MCFRSKHVTQTHLTDDGRIGIQRCCFKLGQQPTFEVIGTTLRAIDEDLVEVGSQSDTEVVHLTDRQVSTLPLRTVDNPVRHEATIFVYNRDTEADCGLTTTDWLDGYRVDFIVVHGVTHHFHFVVLNGDTLLLNRDDRVQDVFTHQLGDVCLGRTLELSVQHGLVDDGRLVREGLVRRQLSVFRLDLHSVFDRLTRVKRVRQIFKAQRIFDRTVHRAWGDHTGTRHLVSFQCDRRNVRVGQQLISKRTRSIVGAVIGDISHGRTYRIVQVIIVTREGVQDRTTGQW